MKKIYKILFTVIILTFMSCDDYLDVQPKGFVIPKTVEDFELLLNASHLSTTWTDYELFLTADDFFSKESQIGDTSNPNNSKLQMYIWSTDLFKGLDVSRPSWNEPYRNIYTYNTVIEGVDDSELVRNYNEGDKKRIKADAIFGRAYQYWLLVNTFAKHYNAATASSDLGVPLVTIPDATSLGEITRASVQEIYDFIISDLESNLEYLPANRANRIRFSKASGFALLARIYLSLGNYEKAKLNASEAILEHGEIGDYNGDVKQSYENEQYLYRYFGFSYGYNEGFFTQELVDLYNPVDLRLTELTSNGINWVLENGSWSQVFTGEYKNRFLNYKNHFPAVAEMYLIRAECNARLSSGTIADVISDLNALRVKRFQAVDYVDLTPAELTDKTVALQFTLEERRREMFITGMRLFDLKRLNLEPAFAKSVTHTVDGVDYTLQAGANNLILPIPGQVMNVNPGMKQNPRD